MQFYTKTCARVDCVRTIVTMRKMFTDVFGKPTDLQQYLHFPSAYLNHIKRSVAPSQILCISRLCFNNSDYERNKEINKAVICKEIVF